MLDQLETVAPLKINRDGCNWCVFVGNFAEAVIGNGDTIPDAIRDWADELDGLSPLELEEVIGPFKLV